MMGVRRVFRHGNERLPSGCLAAVVAHVQCVRSRWGGTQDGDLGLAPWYPKLRRSIIDKAEVESDAHRQQTREGAQRQEQRAQEEHGVTKRTAEKLPSPGADKRVTRGMKVGTQSDGNF